MLIQAYILFARLVLTIECTKVAYYYHGYFLLDAVTTLTANPDATNGTLTVCPGDSISITCTRDTTFEAIEWNIYSVNNVVSCSKTVFRSSPSNTTCGVFAISMISDDSGPTLSSTAQTRATQSLR